MYKKIATAAFSLAVIWLLTTPAAYADDWDKATRFTVNQPFEIPGMILPAGTYIVKIVDLAAERHVVRFMSEDETKIYATLIAIPNFRLEATDETVITFYESELNRPKPLHAWFYPGHRYGVEFVYPKKRAFDIAKVAEEPVIAFREPEAEREEVVPETIPELLEAPLVAVTPGEEDVEIAELYPEFIPTPEPELEPEFAAELAKPLPPVLPRTASPFPLLGLVGLLAAGAATTVRRFRR
jgi:hypothetical protein